LAPVAAAAAGLDLESIEEIYERLSRRRHILRPAGYQRLSDGRFYSRYEFVHALYREVCYQRRAPGSRAAIHLRIGQQLEGLFPDHLADVAAELAHHFEAGADWTSAVKYICIEAQNAEGRHTLQNASELLQHALDLSEHLPTSERVTAQLGILHRLAQILTASNDPRARKFSKTARSTERRPWACKCAGCDKDRHPFGVGIDSNQAKSWQALAKANQGIAISEG